MPADKPARDAPTSLRLHADVLARVERVRAAIEQLAGLAPAIVPSRHGVLLAAILAGLDVLEERHGLGSGQPTRRRGGRPRRP